MWLSLSLMATKKKPVQSKATTTKSAKITRPLPYAAGDLVTFVDRSGKPTSISLVVSAHAKYMMVASNKNDSEPIKIVYAAHDVRTMLPTDAAAIQLRILKRVIANLNENSLDGEALAAISPILGAWRDRNRRRSLRLKASLRVALISGKSVRVTSITINGHPYIDSLEMDDLLNTIGAVDTSVGMGRCVRRTPTREDAIDAIVLREACPPHGISFTELQDAVSDSVPEVEGTAFQKEIIDAAERCGRRPLHSSHVVLQAWDGEVPTS